MSDCYSNIFLAVFPNRTETTYHDWNLHRRLATMLLHAVRSVSAAKFVMVVGKFTNLERRIENLESLQVVIQDFRNEIREMAGKVRDLSVECGSSRKRGIIVEREMKQMPALDRLPSRMDQIDQYVALNTVKIADMESQRPVA